MPSFPFGPDLSILRRLQAQAQQLEALARRHPEFEAVSADFRQASVELQQELDAYRQSRDEWEWFFEHSLDLFAVASFDGHFKRINGAFERCLGYSRDELLATPFLEFVHPDDREPTRAVLQQLGAGQDVIRFENRYRHREGRWRWLEWTCPAPAAGSSCLYAIARDISDTKLSDAERLYRAQHDALTGLGNRALFEEALGKAIARTERNPSNRVALLLLDLDGFRKVNESSGYGIGDALLKTVAGRLASCHRLGDVCCRLGGDEFALLVEGSESVEIGRLAQRLLQLVAQPAEISGLRIEITASVGAALFPEHALDAASLLREANAALQQARQGGPGRFQLGALPG